MKRALCSGLVALAALACSGEPGVTGPSVVTTYFPGDGVLATSVLEDDGTISGTLEDQELRPLASLDWEPSSSTWSWRSEDGDAHEWRSDVLDPTLEASNLVSYVLWLKAHGARVGSDEPEQNYSNKDDCIELSYTFGQCSTIEECEEWCDALP